MEIVDCRAKPGEDFQCPHCGARQSDGGCRDIAACLEALSTTEKNYAGEIANLLDESEQGPLRLLMASFEALELLNLGVAIISGSGQLLLANQVAERILHRRDGLEVTPLGALGTVRRSTPGLRDLIEQVLETPASGAGTPVAVLPVQRSSGKRPLTVVIRPAKGTARASGQGNAALLVFILDPETPLEGAGSELRELYGLTAAETRLAILLMEGLSLEECCAELGVRRSTVCTHLQRLFKKTGVQNQTQLVALLFKSLIPAGVRKAGGEVRSAVLQHAFASLLSDDGFSGPGKP
jgi:DNA-binding CsgD family transcriptional regulator